MTLVRGLTKLEGNKFMEKELIENLIKEIDDMYPPMGVDFATHDLERGIRSACAVTRLSQEGNQIINSIIFLLYKKRNL